MHVINFPDSAGSSCGMCQHCIHLPALNAFTIPNHPNYFLGAEAGSLCDSLSNGVADITSMDDFFSISPNPVTDRLSVSLHRQYGPVISIKVFNAIGEEQPARSNLISKDLFLEIETSLFTSGIYFIEIETSKYVGIKKFIKL